MYESLGKHYDYTDQSKISEYDNIHQDIFLYLLAITNVNRIVSRESLKEFLIRLLLITNQPLNVSISNYSENNELISGTLDSDPFCFKVKDLINFMGLCITTSAYNIKGTISEFIERYEYQAPNIKIEKNEKDKSNYNVSLDYMIFALSGLSSLTKLEYLTVKFKNTLKETSQQEIDSITQFVDVVIKDVDEAIFTDYKIKHSKLFNFTEERFVYSKITYFDPVEEISLKNLNKIYHYIEKIDFNESDFDDAYFEDEHFEACEPTYNTLINFAYGVKHHFIQLSYDYDSYRWAYSLYFDINEDELRGPDEEVYSTGDIYGTYNMKKWEHLLP